MTNYYLFKGLVLIILLFIGFYSPAWKQFKKRNHEKGLLYLALTLIVGIVFARLVATLYVMTLE